MAKRNRGRKGMTGHRRIGNDAARALFLDRHGLLGPGPGGGLAGLIAGLGFVQIDSVNTLARAHDHILWARRQSYRPPDLSRALERGAVFEHWTHDAAAIPMDFYPYWRLKFARDRARCDARWPAWRREGYRDRFDAVLDRIAAHGPVTSAEMGDGEDRGSTGWWDWHPSKTALEYLWRAGRLAVARREGFRKVYDLAENVIPAALRADHRPEAEIVDWACAAALDRLGFATSGELAAFWDIVTPAEAKDWVARALAEGRVEPVEIGLAAGGWRRSVAWPGTAPDPDRAHGSRVRILSPFDPALRDRKRAARLFGFDYRIEIFVPEPCRRYGYYVFPVFEGARAIGRIDMKAERAAGCLSVTASWPEPGVRMGKGRLRRLEAELDRIGRLGGCGSVRFADGWLRGSG